MKNWRRKLHLSSILCAALICISSAYADETQPSTIGRNCVGIADRVERLLCFDNSFKSPIAEPTPQNITTKAENSVSGPMRLIAEALEHQRTVDDVNWILRVRPWHETMLLTLDDYKQSVGISAEHQAKNKNKTPSWKPDNADIFMTLKETSGPDLAGNEKAAIMMLSCDNDITTLAVLLPKPIKTLQAQLSLSSNKGSNFKLNWRDVENGTVVIAGRGLESIATIKTISNYSRLQLQVSYPDGTRAFIFDVGDLKNQLNPLRLACHW